MYEEDLAPDREAQAKEKLTAARQEKRRQSEKIEPAPALTLPQASPAQGPGAETEPAKENENLSNVTEQRAAAGRLQQLSRKRQAIYKHAQKVSTAKGAAQKYKQIRNIMRVAKIGTGLTLYGLILTWLIAHGEWIYHAFNKDYPFTVWDKRATIIADLTIILAVAVILTLVYFIIQSPAGQLILKAVGV